MRKPNILIAGSYAPSLLNFRGKLIEALVSYGYHVIASAPDIDPVTAEGLKKIGALPVSVPLQRTGLNPFADWRYATAIRALIDKYRIDMILSYTIKPNIWCAIAAKTSGIKNIIMVTGLGYAFTRDARQLRLKQVFASAIARILYRYASGRADRLIFQNPDDVSDFIQAGCLKDRSKVCMVRGSGVDLNSFAPCRLPDTASFLMIARLLRNKGVREFGEAAIRVLAERSDVSFSLVGYADTGPDGIDHADLERWQAAGLIYHGQQSDVRPFIAKSAVYVLPSYREGTPRSVLEAMAMGRAVITTDAPGCRTTVDDGVNGYLVPPREVEPLAEAIRRLADRADLRQQMGKESRRIAEALFDVNKVNRDIIATIEAVL
ncbi:glycosyltransferase family 4 protein [Notoacmeibacter marinus]|uniref:glycosyltransferase family 4 protein n=1 Tax=Notoacmeibacter marinus TaxID=1876515 RepID=UPI000DF38006|nr:glycosyltransferase family 4 protein [Notoacmeibacter marinus]